MAGLGLFVGLVMFLRPSVGDEKQTIYVRFSNVNKINVGTRVLFAGKAIGEVTAIREISHARETQPTDELGRIFFYQLTLKIDSNVHVYNTDQIAIQTSGLLGEKSIGIIPRTPPKGVKPELISEKIPFYADSIDPLENTFARLSEIGDKLNNTVDLVKNWFEENGSRITQAVTSISSAMSEIDLLTHSLNEEQIVPDLKHTIASTTSCIQKMDDALGRMTKGGVFDDLGPTVSQLKEATTHFGQVCKDISTGQGTFGKLIQADDMYLRMTAIMSKADTLMNDVNHYGILFHLNKGWQRTRTKRMSELQALESPSSFKSYFEREIDQINTSMARISMLIEKADQDNDKTILESSKFKENFADLMRQINDVSGNLKLYNEQLQETEK